MKDLRDLKGLTMQTGKSGGASGAGGKSLRPKKMEGNKRQVNLIDKEFQFKTLMQ